MAEAEAETQAEAAERHGHEAFPIALAVGKAASEAASVCSSPWAGSAPRVGRAGSRKAGRAAVDCAHSDDGTVPASPAAEIVALAAPSPDDGPDDFLRIMRVGGVAMNETTMERVNHSAKLIT